MCLQTLREAISLEMPFSDKEWELLSTKLHALHLKRGEHLLREGEVCQRIAFVCSGTLIYYKLLDNGNEATTDFAFRGDWVNDNRSRLCALPSAINIKAIRDSDLVTISHSNLTLCYSAIPKLERLGRLLIEQAFVKITQQSIDLQTLSATERYDKLLGKHPQIFQDAPLHHIANYLGIAPKSLSRIRHAKAKL